MQLGFERESEGGADPLLVQRSILEGLVWGYKKFSEIAHDELASNGERLRSCELTVDAGYNVALRMTGELKLEFLLQMKKDVDLLLVFAQKSSNGKLSLYYKYKYYDFVANSYVDMDRSEMGLKYYQLSLEVWEEMDRNKVYGSGNGVVDPYAEGCTTLNIIAQLICHLKLAPPEQGLEAIKRSKYLYRKVWGGARREDIPKQREYYNTLDLVAESSCETNLKHYETAWGLLKEAAGTSFMHMPCTPTMYSYHVHVLLPYLDMGTCLA